MSSYYCKTVSNTVKVKDINKFEQAISKTLCRTADLAIYKYPETSEIRFYCDAEMDIDNNISNIQDLLQNDQVLIIQEVGYDTSKDTYSQAHIISNRFVDFINFNNIVQERVKNLKEVISFKTND
jgi:hypothetical protein